MECNWQDFPLILFLVFLIFKSAKTIRMVEGLFSFLFLQHLVFLAKLLSCSSRFLRALRQNRAQSRLLYLSNKFLFPSTIGS